MKLKRVIICFIILMLSFVGGCTNDNSDNALNNDPLITYDISDFDFYNECSVCNSEEDMIVYFPVVTNKEITMVETGGISASFNRKDSIETENIVNVRLEKKEQDFINLKFENYYISFIKYRVTFSDWKNLNLYNSINLCETRIWVYNKEEYKTIDYDNIYMVINIVQREEEKNFVDWTKKIDVMLNQIKIKLKKTYN